MMRAIELHSEIWNMAICSDEMGVAPQLTAVPLGSTIVPLVHVTLALAEALPRRQAHVSSSSARRGKQVAMAAHDGRVAVLC